MSTGSKDDMPYRDGEILSRLPENKVVYSNRMVVPLQGEKSRVGGIQRYPESLLCFRSGVREYRCTQSWNSLWKEKDHFRILSSYPLFIIYDYLKVNAR